MKRRLVLAGVVLAGVAVLAGAWMADDDCKRLTLADVPRPTMPASPLGDEERACGKAVILDWYSDGVVDGGFGLRCYGSALALLPTGGLDYSTVRDDIRTAYEKRYVSLHACAPARSA